MKTIVERWDQYKLGNGPYTHNPQNDKEFDTLEEAEEYMRTADSGFWNDTRHYYKIKGT